LAFLTLPVLLLVPCHSQKKEAQTPEFKVPVDVIVVSATVTDKNGESVLGLTAGRFQGL
jgi:hypothetical protein